MAIVGNVTKLESQLEDYSFKIVFDYFKQAINSESEVYKRIFSLPVGAFERVDLSDGIFALEQVFYTKDRKKCFIESHKKYIDFQLILSGVEQMEYIDISKLEVERQYDEEKDLIIYKFVDNTSKFLLEKNDLAVFFPDDGHIGLPKYQNSELVHKTVIKFPLMLLK